MVWLVYGIALRDTVFHLAVTGWQAWGEPRSWIAPVGVYAAGLVGYFARSMRSFLLEELDKEYVRTARAKGLTERTVVMRHAFRNALIPLATIIPLDIAAILSGAVITERIFGWTGMGNMFITALNGDDPYPVMGFFLVTGTVAVLANLVADGERERHVSAVVRSLLEHGRGRGGPGRDPSGLVGAAGNVCKRGGIEGVESIEDHRGQRRHEPASEADEHVVRGGRHRGLLRC